MSENTDEVQEGIAARDNAAGLNAGDVHLGEPDLFTEFGLREISVEPGNDEGLPERQGQRRRAASYML